MFLRSFNRDLMHARGAAIGAEFKGKGVHVGLGPMMNIMRAPAGGRAWAGYVRLSVKLFRAE